MSREGVPTTIGEGADTQGQPGRRMGSCDRYEGRRGIKNPSLRRTLLRAQCPERPVKSNLSLVRTTRHRRIHRYGFSQARIPFKRSRPRNDILLYVRVQNTRGRSDSFKNLTRCRGPCAILYPTHPIPMIIPWLRHSLLKRSSNVIHKRVIQPHVNDGKNWKFLMKILWYQLHSYRTTRDNTKDRIMLCE